jgi:excisionase family DNA binding protein
MTWRGEQLYTVAEAAKVLDLSRGRVYAAIKAGRLGWRKGTRNVILVSDSDIDDFNGTPGTGNRPRTARQARRASDAASARCAAAGW